MKCGFILESISLIFHHHLVLINLVIIGLLLPLLTQQRKYGRFLLAGISENPFDLLRVFSQLVINSVFVGLGTAVETDVAGVAQRYLPNRKGLRAEVRDQASIFPVSSPLGSAVELICLCVIFVGVDTKVEAVKAAVAGRGRVQHTGDGDFSGLGGFIGLEISLFLTMKKELSLIIFYLFISCGGIPLFLACHYDSGYKTRFLNGRVLV